VVEYIVSRDKDGHYQGRLCNGEGCRLIASSREFPDFYVKFLHSLSQISIDAQIKAPDKSLNKNEFNALELGINMYRSNLGLLRDKKGLQEQNSKLERKINELDSWKRAV
jgi:hypothetical protein